MDGQDQSGIAYLCRYGIDRFSSVNDAFTVALLC